VGSVAKKPTGKEDLLFRKAVRQRFKNQHFKKGGVKTSEELCKIPKRRKLFRRRSCQSALFGERPHPPGEKKKRFREGETLLPPGTTKRHLRLRSNFRREASKREPEGPGQGNQVR